jgi:hypothetical protein
MSLEEWKNQTLELWALEMSDPRDIKNIAESHPKLIERQGCSIYDLPVRELMGWVRSFVLMNVYLGLENPGGLGFWVGGYMSQGREMGKLVYEQPGNEVDGSCHN